MSRPLRLEFPGAAHHATSRGNRREPIYRDDVDRQAHPAGVVGHLFQGRSKAILVDRDSYLLSLCRYVENKPVAAGLANSADCWIWSSYRAHVMQAATPPWLDSAGLHGFLLGREAVTDADSNPVPARERSK